MVDFFSLDLFGEFLLRGFGRQVAWIYSSTRKVGRYVDFFFYLSITEWIKLVKLPVGLAALLIC